MDARSIAGLAGFLTALIGLLFLFVPVHAEVGVDCGHVFGGGATTDDGLADQSVVSACSAARTDRWEYSLPLLVIGGAVAIGASMPERPAERSNATTVDDETA